MLKRNRGIWMAFCLWAIALVAVMVGLTLDSSLMRSHRVSSATVVIDPAATAETDAPPKTPSTLKAAGKLAVQWTIVLMAIGAVGLLLRVTLDLSERRKNFAAAVTHELRTPLTTLRMYSEMLESGLVDGEEKQRQYLRTLRLEAGRLQRIVDNVLTHARLDEDRLEQHLEPSALGDAIDSLRPRLEERCAQSEMNFSAALNDETDRALINVDSLALERILFNLVENSCKYAAVGDDRVIQLETHREGERLLCSVTDHGPGISPSDVSGLFRAYDRGEKAGAEPGGGIGLGLSISRRLAREMGGDLHHDATYTQGCRMTLTLPHVSE